MHPLKKLQRNIVSGGFSYAGATLLMFGAWSVHYSLGKNYILGLLGYLLVGQLIIWLHKMHILIIERTSITAVIFGFTGACCLPLHAVSPGLEAAIFLIMALHFLMKSYRSPNPQMEVLHTFVMLGFGCILYPKLTYLIPVFMVGSYICMSMDMRSFWAALLGWIVPFSFLLCYAFAIQDIDVFVSPFLRMVDFGTFGIGYELWQLPMFLVLLLLLVVGATHFYTTNLEDRLRTRLYLNFLVILSTVLLVAVLVQPQDAVSLFPLSAVPVSIIAGHYFSLTHSRVSGGFLAFILCWFLGTFIFTLWMR